MGGELSRMLNDRPIEYPTGTARARSCEQRSVAGGAIVLGVPQPGLWPQWEGLVFALVVLLLGSACFIIWRSRKRERRMADADRDRHARELAELLHGQRVRIQEAIERGSMRERERADNDLTERLGALMRTVVDGFAAIDERLDGFDQREVAREEAVRKGLEEAMVDLRRAGRASIRYVLERCGLAVPLEDMCWSLRASGRMSVALQMNGLEQPFVGGEQIAIYHLVNDAVEASLGFRGVDRLAIRVDRQGGGCVLSVESNGTEVAGGSLVSERGSRRLEHRVAQLNGSIERSEQPEGGYALKVRIPLGG